MSEVTQGAEQTRPQFQQVRGRTQGAAPQSVGHPIGGNADQEHKDAALRAQNRMLGRTQNLDENGDPLSDLDVEITDEEIRREIRRNVDLLKASAAPVAKRVGTLMEEALGNYGNS